MNRLRIRRSTQATDESPKKTEAAERTVDDEAATTDVDAARAGRGESVEPESAEPEAADGEARDAETEDSNSDDVVADDVQSDAVAFEREAAGPDAANTGRGGFDWMRVLVYGALPALALILAIAAGYSKWVVSSARNAEVAAIESVQVARDSTVALLSYKPDTVEQDLTAVRDRLTGQFRDSYTQLTNDVVIPGSKQQQITAVAMVPAAGSVMAEAHRAVVLVFVNQTTTIGTDRPTDSASSVRVTLDKVGDQWLISGFDPV